MSFGPSPASPLNGEPPAVRSRGGGEILLRFQMLRLRGRFRILRDYPMTTAIGALVVVLSLAGARARLEQAPEIAANAGLVGAAIGILAGWVATAAMGRWLSDVSEGPLGRLVAGRRTAEMAAVIQVLLAGLCILALVQLLLPPEARGLRISGGYVLGVMFGMAVSGGAIRLWRSIQPLRRGKVRVAKERAARSLPPRALTIVLHLRRPGRSWGVGFSALLLVLAGIAAGQFGSRDGVEVGHFVWYGALAWCGFIVLAPHTSLLRTLATYPSSVAILFVDLMAGPAALQFSAALFSAAWVFDRPADVLVWAIAATAIPALISAVRFLYGLMYEKTLGDLRFCLDLAFLAIGAALIGPLMLAALPPWLWLLYRKAERMRWGRQ